MIASFTLNLEMQWNLVQRFFYEPAPTLDTNTIKRDAILIIPIAHDYMTLCLGRRIFICFSYSMDPSTI